MRLKKIVSGGQTGVDRGALDAALALGFPCGGRCPPGRLAEDGRIPELYPLVEMPSGGYRERTIQNVVESDGTLVIYFGRLHGGTEQTILHCIRLQKPYKLVDGDEISPERAAELGTKFVEGHNVSVLNVAGPRQSQCARGYAYAYEAITRLLRNQSERGGAKS